MPYRLAADAIVLLHAAFVLFVVLGGLLALRWRRSIWLHLPAAAWGIAVEVAGWTCPLTPLENRLRRAGGGAGYGGGFVEERLLPLLYPEGLSRADQVLLGLLALSFNAAVYGWLLLRRARERRIRACEGIPDRARRRAAGPDARREEE